MSSSDERRDEAAYMEKMLAIVTASSGGGIRASRGPSQLLDHLYIGSGADAADTGLLRRLHITHVLNCAAGERLSGRGSSPYCDGATDVRAYSEFDAVDSDGYPILMHFTAARAFIDSAAQSGGRALVHCHLGVNRSGAICVAYVMVHDDVTLLQALRRVKLARPVVLCNEHFRRELVRFARNRCQLYKHQRATADDNQGTNSDMAEPRT